MNMRQDNIAEHAHTIVSMDKNNKHSERVRERERTSQYNNTNIYNCNTFFDFVYRHFGWAA